MLSRVANLVYWMARYLERAENTARIVDVNAQLVIDLQSRQAADDPKSWEPLVYVTGDNEKLWLYPEKVYEAMAEGAPQDLAPGEEQLEFDHLHYGLAERLEWDNQGRVLIPDEEMTETGTGKDVVLFGARNHLEIWNRTDFETHRTSLRARRKEISLRAKSLKSGQVKTVQGSS